MCPHVYDAIYRGTWICKYIKGKQAFKRDNRFRLKFVCVEYPCERKHTYFHLDDDFSFAVNTTLLEGRYL